MAEACDVPRLPGATEVAAVREALLPWFREHARDLPWRRTRDPYRILVSEVMLQQIQVRRAVPFYERFVARFPTVASLAAAPLAEAIRAWGDLGRYRRVVNLHRTARLVVEEHGGEIPADPDVLVTLPGVGPYTAGAVACFAFEKEVAFADTNVRRVLLRRFFGPDEPAGAAAERGLLALAAHLLPPGRAWEWNQALIEMGALVCTSRKPACGRCPLRDGCRARGAIAGGKAPRERKDATHRYEGSNRYYRGRVLAQLRACDGGLDVRDLGRRVCEDFAEKDVPWLWEIVDGLKDDGLVAEEGAPYGSGGNRVRLPEDP
jgi:A/G-specific adenine glycosylase